MTDIPAWARLKGELAESIRSGARRPGDRLPSERALALETGLSVGTVRKALEALVGEGLCYRAQGRGTFVTTPPSDTAVFFRMKSSLSSDDDMDILPSSLARTSETPPEEIGAALGLPADAKCIRIRRVLHRRTESAPVFLGVSDSWFHPVLCRRLAKIPLEEFRSRSLYALLRDECGQPMAVADEWLSIAPSIPGDLLQNPDENRDGAYIVMNMLSHTAAHQPLEYRTSYVATRGAGLIRRHRFS